MDFTVFDTSKLDAYAAKEKEAWGNTDEYHEFEEKTKGRTREEEKNINVRFMEIFTEFGKMKEKNPQEASVQAEVKKLQNFITEHFYRYQASSHIKPSITSSTLTISAAVWLTGN